VLFGFYSWVGYGKGFDKSLPEIKKSILSPIMLISNYNNLDADKLKLTNLRYSKDYRVEKDIYIIWKCIKKLGI
jgi:hypothetical protein